jgi:hypothetical protein
MFIDVGTIIVIVIIVFAILFLRRPLKKQTSPPERKAPGGCGYTRTRELSLARVLLSVVSGVRWLCRWESRL